MPVKDNTKFADLSAYSFTKKQFIKSSVGSFWCSHWSAVSGAAVWLLACEAVILGSGECGLRSSIHASPLLCSQNLSLEQTFLCLHKFGIFA